MVTAGIGMARSLCWVKIVVGEIATSSGRSNKRKGLSTYMRRREEIQYKHQTLLVSEARGVFTMKRKLRTWFARLHS
jgi:hypothetical protein